MPLIMLKMYFLSEKTPWCTGGSAYQSGCPNSKCVVKIGWGKICSFPNDYFEEFRGFYPDLWVPADEAEELAVKLMENLGAVQAEGEAASPAA